MVLHARLGTEDSEPIRVSMRYEGILSDETFVAHGEWFFNYVFGDTTMVYRLLSASDSLGYLVCEMPPSEGSLPRLHRGALCTPGNANDASEGVELLGVDGHRTETTDHFEIKYPVDLIEVSMSAVGTMLEDLYATIVNDMQLPWPWLPLVQVSIRDMGSVLGASSMLKMNEDDPDSLFLNINRHHLSQNVSDTYLEESNIDLKIQMSSEIEPVGLGYNRCWMSLNHLRGYYWRDYFDQSEQDYTYFNSWIDFWSETAEGSFDFTSMYDTHYSGSVSARVVGDPPERLVYFQLQQTVVNDHLTRKTWVRTENIDVFPGYLGLDFLARGSRS